LMAGRMWPAIRSSRVARAKDGGLGQNRTVDTTIFSRVLYQLSYQAGTKSRGK
jgi:hypothetical protein